MNKFILIVLFLFVASVSFAGEICLAHKNWKGDMSAKLNYVVKCQNEIFETEAVTVTYVLPLPFHWGKAARKYLYKEMSKRRFTEVAKFIPIQKKNGSEFIHIFEKEDSRNRYCSVMKYNHKETQFDVVIACQGMDGDSRFTGLTGPELKSHMESKRYRKALVVDFIDEKIQSDKIEIYKSIY